MLKGWCGMNCMWCGEAHDESAECIDWPEPSVDSSRHHRPSYLKRVRMRARARLKACRDCGRDDRRLVCDLSALAWILYDVGKRVPTHEVQVVCRRCMTIREKERGDRNGYLPPPDPDVDELDADPGLRARKEMAIAGHRLFWGPPVPEKSRRGTPRDPGRKHSSHQREQKSFCTSYCINPPDKKE